MKVANVAMTLPRVAGNLKSLSSSIKSVNKEVQTRTATANRSRVHVKV